MSASVPPVKKTARASLPATLPGPLDWLSSVTTGNRHEDLQAMLRRLNVSHIAEIFADTALQATKAGWSHEAFLYELATQECVFRSQRRMERNRRASHLPREKTFQTLQPERFSPTLQLQIERLRTGQFVEEASNVVAVGRPGVGKTHLATALAVQALEAGHSVMFSTLSQLADGLESGAQFQSWRGRLRRYVQPHVLVIDEIGYTHLTPAQAHALFELVNARYEKGAILLTSNTSFAEWGSLLGNEVLASALLDRLLHHAEVISINGPSYRMKDRLPAGKVPVSA